KLLEAQLLVTPAEKRQDLEQVRNLIQSHTRRLARYRCENCGFKARQFYWHCPACGGWETYPPKRTEEFDQKPEWNEEVKSTMVGTGYVGLVTGACFAEVGNDVLCLDTDEKKIRTLESGGIPIYEPGLSDVVKRNVAAGRLHFTTDIARAVSFGTVQCIAVGTPPGEDGAAGLRHVVAAARNVGRHMNGYKGVVHKSTPPALTPANLPAA